MKKYLKSMVAMTLATTLTLSVSGVNVYADTTTGVVNGVEVKDTVLSYGSTYFLLEDGTLWANNADGDFVKFYDNVKSISKSDWGSLFIILEDDTLISGYYYPENAEKDTLISGYYYPENTEKDFTEIATDVKAAAGTYESMYILKTDGTLWHAGVPYEETIDDTGAEILSVDLSATITAVSIDDKIASLTGYTQIAENVESIDYSGGFGYFTDKNGDLWIHGYDDYVSSGFENPKFETPERIMSDVADFSVNYYNLYVLDTKNNLYRGDAYDIRSLFESNIKSNLVESKVKSFEPTDSGIFIIKEDDSLWAKGANYTRELGLDTDEYSEEFVKIDEDVVEVYNDNTNHSLYLKEDGSYWGMGDNYYNQLGVVEYTGEKYFDEDGKRFVMSDVEDMFFTYNYGIITKTDDSLWKLGSEIYETPEETSLVNIANDVRTANTDGNLVEYVVGDNRELFVDDSLNYVTYDYQVYIDTGLEVLKSLGYDVSGTNKVTTFERIVSELQDEKYTAFADAFTAYVKKKYTETPLASDVAYVEGLYYIDTKNNLHKLEYNGEDEVIASDVLDVSVGDDYVLIVNTDNELLRADLYEPKEITVDGPLDENYNNKLLDDVDTIDSYDEVKNADGTISTKIAYFEPVENLEFLPTGLDNIADVKATYFTFTTLDLDGNLINYNAYFQGTTEEKPTLTIGSDSYYPKFTASKVKSFDTNFESLAYVTENDELWVVGQNYNGNIANIDIYGDYIEEPIETLDNVQKVALGARDSYILTLDNELYGMGQNAFGELGFKPQGTLNVRTTVFKPTELEINFVGE